MNQQALNEKLKELESKVIAIETVADNRVYLPCESDSICDICKFLITDIGARFVVATGIDCDDCFEILYHFSYDETGCVITVKAFIPDRDNPRIDSITPLIPGAEWTEREMYDLLGINFRNHPRLERLLLADDWPEGVYPLRKDAKL